MQSIVPVLFLIDAENDEFAPGRTDRSVWSSVEECFARLDDYRGMLSASTAGEARFNWMLRADPQIEAIYGDAGWGLRHYAPAWDRLRSRGDDIGLHPHRQRWSESEVSWICPDDSERWVESVLDSAVQAYRRVFDTAPSTLRFGNRFMNQRVAAHAQALGFRYDLTLEPGYPGRAGMLPEERVAGFCRNYFEIPRAPYRPSAADFLVPDPARRSGMWFIPISTAPVGAEVPCSGAPYHRAVAPESNAYEPLHLRMPPDQFRRAVDHLLRELARPYLVVVIRADMIRLPEVWANLETLRTHSRASHFRFTTSAEALRILGYEQDAAAACPAA